MKKYVASVVIVGMLCASAPASAQMEQLLGGVLGAAVGGSRGPGGAIAGAIVGVALATILQQLTANEQQQRQVALKAASKKGKASWRSAGKDGKKATYKKVAAAEDIGGKKCFKVLETITLADGKQGT
ncbi:MAG: hypothetical protein RIR25_1708, partial [Verrucomicrobiota bacterium]